MDTHHQDIELKKINKYKAPKDKLVCIRNCSKVVYKMLESAAGHGLAAGADDFLPLLIIVLIRANPANLQSNIQCVDSPSSTHSPTGTDNCFQVHSSFPESFQVTRRSRVLSHTIGICGALFVEYQTPISEECHRGRVPLLHEWKGSWTSSVTSCYSFSG